MSFEVFCARFAAFRPVELKNELAGSSCARAYGVRKIFGNGICGTTSQALAGWSRHFSHGFQACGQAECRDWADGGMNRIYLLLPGPEGNS